MATTVLALCLGGEAMTTLGATGGEHLATGMGSLAGAVAKFAGATDLGRTESGFHDERDV